MKQMKVSHTQQIVERDKTIATLKEENESQRNGLFLIPRDSIPKICSTFRTFLAKFLTLRKKSTEIIRRTSIAAAYLRSMRILSR